MPLGALERLSDALQQVEELLVDEDLAPAPIDARLDPTDERERADLDLLRSGGSE